MEVPAGDRRLASYMRERGWDRVARRYALVDTTRLPGLLALSEGAVVGVLAYQVTGAACEVVVIHASEPIAGIGTALLERMIELARSTPGMRSGPGELAPRPGVPDDEPNVPKTSDTAPSAPVVWLVTMNDNVDAIRFYQRRGFKISTIRPGAVDDARRDLKPDIPEFGSYGIPMRDELEFVRDL